MSIPKKPNRQIEAFIRRARSERYLTDGDILEVRSMLELMPEFADDGDEAFEEDTEHYEPFPLERHIEELRAELRGVLDAGEAKQIEAELEAAQAERARRDAMLERER